LVRVPTAAILFLQVLLQLVGAEAEALLLMALLLAVLAVAVVFLTVTQLRFRVEPVFHSKAMLVVVGQTVHHQTNNR
jgi:hypothetical protein